MSPILSSHGQLREPYYNTLQRELHETTNIEFSSLITNSSCVLTSTYFRKMKTRNCRRTNRLLSFHYTVWYDKGRIENSAPVTACFEPGVYSNANVDYNITQSVGSLYIKCTYKLLNKQLDFLIWIAVVRTVEVACTRIRGLVMKVGQNFGLYNEGPRRDSSGDYWSRSMSPCLACFFSGLC
jgi:hypothetical protein